MLKTHKGKFALIKDKEIIGFYDLIGDANKEGMSKYPDENFSIQEVTEDIIDLGFYSHAVNI